MRYEKTKVQAWGKVYGGKLRYARQYIEFMQKSHECDTYCEPYAAGAGVGINIERSQFDTYVYNDIDTNINSVVWSLIYKPDQVYGYLKKYFYNYNKQSFDLSLKHIGDQRHYVHAAAFIARNRMSSQGRFERFAATDTKVRLRGGRMGDENAYLNFIDNHFWRTVHAYGRFRGSLYNRCALSVIADYASPGTLFFLDPPYLNETLVTPNPYVRMVDRTHHETLLDLITCSKGQFYICGYYSDLYNRILWRNTDGG